MPDPQVQAKLDQLVSRLDEEMAKASAQYQDARGDLADHHAKMATEADAAEAGSEALRPSLDGVVFGDKSVPAGFAKQAGKYLDLQRKATQARRARRMGFGATQKPGKVPTGQPLGVPPAPAE